MIKQDKAQITSILNSFKNDLFYTHLVSLRKNFQYRCCISREIRGKSCENPGVFYHN